MGISIFSNKSKFEEVKNKVFQFFFKTKLVCNSLSMDLIFELYTSKYSPGLIIVFLGNVHLKGIYPSLDNPYPDMSIEFSSELYISIQPE